MKQSSRDNQLGWASPLECAASQRRSRPNPSRNETGLDASHNIHVSPRGRGEIFLLTSSLIGQLTVVDRISGGAIWAQSQCDAHDLAVCLTLGVHQSIPIYIHRGRNKLTTRVTT